MNWWQWFKLSFKATIVATVATVTVQGAFIVALFLIFDPGPELPFPVRL